MIDFSILKSLTIPEGVVIKIVDAFGNQLWEEVNISDTVSIQVEKITSNTFANNTTYSNEEFILIEALPKANSSCTVSYGGLTKTITNNTEDESPFSVQKVFFGTFNGVTDEYTTPSNGELIIEGDYLYFQAASYNTAKSTTTVCDCITAINDFGQSNYDIAPTAAFKDCTKL